MCLSNRLLVTKCLKMKFKIGSLLVFYASVIHRSALSSTNKSIPLKMVRYKDCKLREKAVNVQRETFKDLQKAWRTITKDITKESAFLEPKYKEMSGGSSLLHNPVLFYL